VGVPATLLRAGAEHRARGAEMGMRRGSVKSSAPPAALNQMWWVIKQRSAPHRPGWAAVRRSRGAKCENHCGECGPARLVVIPAGDPLLEAALSPSLDALLVRPCGPAGPAQLQATRHRALPPADWTGALTPAGLVCNGRDLRLAAGGRTTPAICCWPWRWQTHLGVLR